MKRILFISVIIVICMSLSSCNNYEVITFGEYHNLTSENELQPILLIKSGIPPKIIEKFDNKKLERVFDYLLTMKITDSRTNRNSSSITTEVSNYSIQVDVKDRIINRIVIGDTFILVDKSTRDKTNMVVHTIDESSIDKLESLLDDIIQ